MRHAEDNGHERHETLEVGLGVADVAAAAVVTIAQFDENVGGETQHDNDPEATVSDESPDERARAASAVLDQKIFHDLRDRDQGTGGEHGVADQLAEHATGRLVLIGVLLKGVFDGSRAQPGDDEDEASVGGGSNDPQGAGHEDNGMAAT